MKTWVLMALAAYLSFAATFTAVGGIDVDAVLAAGPIAAAAFAIGYAIDILIFGAVVRGVRRKMRARSATVVVE